MTLLNEWAGLSDTLGYSRPAEDRDITLFPLSLGSQLYTLQRDRLSLI